MIEYVKAQRKFTLALTFAVFGILGLFTGFLDGGEFIALAGLILGLYAAANVSQRAVEK